MMYFKLSINNMRKSFKDYAIYFMTLIFGVCIFYIFNSIGAQGALLELSASKNKMVENLVNMMEPVSVFVSMILAYLIVYANNFLIRRRKKEFGLYQTLGMGKWKIAQLLFLETLIVGVISLCAGLLIGVFASQGLSVVIAHMFEADLSGYTFVFSREACYKTCLYFSLIYIFAMIFNIITVSRYKLVELLTAAQKNEKLKVRNPHVTLALFVVAIASIGYAYYLLKFKNAMVMVTEGNFVLMLVLGAGGTYLLFVSLGGFLLKMVQLNKKLYLRNLNMFVLRQINSRINSMTISLTMISLMLLLTIGIMASALSLIGVFNNDLRENNLVDVSIIYYNDKLLSADEAHDIEKSFQKDGFPYKDYLKEYVAYNRYQVEKSTTTFSHLVGEESIEQIHKNYGDAVNFEEDYFPTILESEYNKLMELSGKEEYKVDLKDNEFAVVSNFPEILKYINMALKEGRTLDYGKGTMIPKYNHCIEVPLSNSNTASELGTVIVSDKVYDSSFKQELNMICGNYKADNTTKEEVEEKFMSLTDKYYGDNQKVPYTNIFTKQIMEASSVGISAIAVFVGLYLGIIFSITSAAILAIGQLSESSNNKVRYSILRKIGVDERMINVSLLLQIVMYFMFPLAVAIVHSIVGLSEVNKLIKLFGNMDITKNVFITALFIILIYGSYFIATYIGSKNIIKEQENLRN